MDVKHTLEKQSLSKTMTEELIISKIYNTIVDTAIHIEKERRQIAFWEAVSKQTDIIKYLIIILNLEMQ
jgi:hypothetical protein